MEDNKGFKLREIDLGEMLKLVLKFKKLFIINVLVSAVVGGALILCVPRFYTCDVKLAPETTNMNVSGNLGALASSFGLNMANLSNQDAIVPELYPDLMESVDFRTGMFPIKITTKDGKLTTDYYDYLFKHQKLAWWDKIIAVIAQQFKSKTPGMGGKGVNPFMMSKDQSDIAKIIGSKVVGTVDKKTQVITITVEDQDPLVCATIADSARVRLQEAITDYRTNKARLDLNYARKINAEAKRQYDKARQLYASFSDANQDLVLESVKAKQEDLENEMQLKYNNYQQTSQQVQLAIAKLQERTPAFTVLQSASVPIKPTGPKRMIFVALCIILTFGGTFLYVYKKEK